LPFVSLLPEVSWRTYSTLKEGKTQEKEAFCVAMGSLIEGVLACKAKMKKNPFKEVFIFE